MEIGSKLELQYIVEEDDLAKVISLEPEDKFPAVLATSKMIALMELAAARLMKPLLANTELSVGVVVNVTHMAATPLGQEVKAVATFKGMQGKLYKFDVQLLDAGGIAGSGTHTRAIVDTERIQSGAAKRVSIAK